MPLLIASRYDACVELTPIDSANNGPKTVGTASEIGTFARKLNTSNKVVALVISSEAVGCPVGGDRFGTSKIVVET
jgi:hypothetical protein